MKSHKEMKIYLSPSSVPYPAVRRRPVVLQDDLRGHVDGRARPRRQRGVRGRVPDREAEVGRPDRRRGHSCRLGSFRLFVAVEELVGVEKEEVVRLS